MLTRDSLQRFIFEQAPIRGECVRLEESYQTILAQHDYPQPLRKLLGEALCVAAMLAAIIKFKGRLTVQFRGKGRLKLLLAQCDNAFNLRALAKWDGDLSYSELMEAFNDGVLVIMLDSGQGKTPYQGIVAWRGNSLVQSIENYFEKSEQLATKIFLQVNETAATGMLFQVIPADKKQTDVTNEVVAAEWARILQVTSIHPMNMLNTECESLLSQLFPTDEIRIFAPIPLTFHCTCSRKRGEDAILLLGQEEAEAELKNKQSIVVTCDFCNKEYLFDPIDITKIFKNRDQTSTSIH